MTRLHPARQEAGGALAVLLVLAALAPLCCSPSYRRCCIGCLSCCGHCKLPRWFARRAADEAVDDEKEAKVCCAHLGTTGIYLKAHTLLSI